jgi:CubicO group peptidase (beta-lactamase class C family)
MKFDRVMHTAPSSSRLQQSILLSSILVALGACGGGGGGGGGGNSAPPAPPAASNVAPSPNAGADQTIELPTSTVQLTGTATDDNLPAPPTLTYTWSASSPTVTFETANAAATKAKFSEAGTYTLTLNVSDGQLSATDTVQVVVNGPVYPAAEWTTATPAEMNMDVAKLDTAKTYATSVPQYEGSGIIVRRGRVVYSWGPQDTRYDVKSATKSIGGVALGLALEDGRLALTDKANLHMPTMGIEPNKPKNPWVDEITVLQLGTHTAGFPKSGAEGAPVVAPGTQWRYSDGGLNWLADTLTTVYAQDLNSLLFTRVYSKIGITPADLTWRSAGEDGVGTNDDGLRTDQLNVNGTSVKRRELAAGIKIDVKAMARVGQLFLRDGVWNGERLLPKSFVDTVRTARDNKALPIVSEDANDTYSKATENYGVLWWTNKTGASGDLPGVPADAYWAWGLGDSLIVVIPSLDLVIARGGVPVPGTTDPTPTTRTWNDWNWDGDYKVLVPFLTPIVESVTDD